jgi:hypothetical protein
MSKLEIRSSHEKLYLGLLPAAFQRYATRKTIKQVTPATRSQKYPHPRRGTILFSIDVCAVSITVRRRNVKRPDYLRPSVLSLFERMVEKIHTKINSALVSMTIACSTRTLRGLALDREEEREKHYGSSFISIGGRYSL